ncbi:MAG: ABC transporter permease [Polyangiales bacterium]
MREAFFEIIEGVTRHRVRAAATAFGVFWGIFMLAMLLGGGRGLRNGFERLFQNSAISAMWAEAGHTTKSFQGLGPGRKLQLEIGDIDALKKSIPELLDISPRQLLPVSESVRRGGRVVSLPVYGVYASFAKVEMTQAVRGRALNELDNERSRRVVIVGSRARELLFGDASPVGEHVGIGGIDFTIVGEYHDACSEDERRRIYMPYSTLVRSFDGGAGVQTITATIRPDADPQQVRASVLRVMGRRHRFDATDVAALDVFFLAEEFKRLQMLLYGIDIAIFTVGFGTLLSGMVGVSNILFVSIRERAREFGVRRALGASASTILMMVIAEALMLALFAGGLGLLAALGAIKGLQSLAIDSPLFTHPDVDGSAIAGALGILVVTALFAGYFPAREAARMTPIEALRQE